MRRSTLQALAEADPDQASLGEAAAYFLDTLATLLAFVRVYPRGVDAMVLDPNPSPNPYPNPYPNPNPNLRPNL